MNIQVSLLYFCGGCFFLWKFGLRPQPFEGAKINVWRVYQFVGFFQDEILVQIWTFPIWHLSYEKNSHIYFYNLLYVEG